MQFWFDLENSFSSFLSYYKDKVKLREVIILKITLCKRFMSEIKIVFYCFLFINKFICESMSQKSQIKRIKGEEISGAGVALPGALLLPHWTFWWDATNTLFVQDGFGSKNYKTKQNIKHCLIGLWCMRAFTEKLK